MEGLTEDLRAMVNAKEITLAQAVELNKQKAPKEEGIDTVVNLWGDLNEYDRSMYHDMILLRGGSKWEAGSIALLSPGRRRRPGKRVQVYCMENAHRDMWQLLHVRNMPPNGNCPIVEEMPEHPLQPGIHGLPLEVFVQRFDSDIQPTEDVIETKFFICSLASKTVFHFSTKGAMPAHFDVCFKNLAQSKAYTPLPGHNATRSNLSKLTVDGFCHNTYSTVQVWVRFKDDAVSTRFINPESGPVVKEAEPVMESSAPRGSLKLVHQPSLDEDTVGSMAMETDYSIEMQNLMLSELPESVSGKAGSCFLCQGTGKRHVAEKYVYGRTVAEEWKQASEDMAGDVEKKTSTSSASDVHVRTIELQTFNHRSRKVMPSPVDILRQKLSEDDGDGKYDRCFLCMGTGAVSKLKDAIVVENDVDDSEVDDCLICWSYPQKYGISTECTHFFCEVCIKGHLQNVMNTGKFPGYCPVCQASAPKGEEPRYGKISGKALSYLEKHGVIDKEFQFMFMRKQEELEELFFECPAKCGNYLVDVDPTYVLRKDKVAVRVERCPCGQGVCVQCHQPVEDKDLETHTCPDGSQAKSQQDDIATIALMKKLGKKCPHCNMFIMKNSGCDVMMCGDKAHGDLRKAIRNGGCGLTFMWSTLKVIEDNITDLNGKRVRCNPTVKYKNEIAAYKKKLGILLSNEENLLADLVLSAGRPNGGKVAKGPVVQGRELFLACYENDINHVARILALEYEKDERKKKSIDVDFQMPNHNFGFTDRGMLWILVFWYPILLLCAICKKQFRRNLMTVKVMALFAAMPLSMMWFLGTFFIYVDQLFPVGIYAFLFSYLFHLVTTQMAFINQYNTPLTSAIFHGNIDMVKLLLLHDASAVRQTTSGLSPLYAASVYGRTKICHSLYDYGPHAMVEPDSYLMGRPMVSALLCCSKPARWRREDCKSLLLWLLKWGTIPLILLVVQLAFHGTCNNFIRFSHCLCDGKTEPYTTDLIDPVFLEKKKVYASVRVDILCSSGCDKGLKPTCGSLTLEPGKWKTISGDAEKSDVFKLIEEEDAAVLFEVSKSPDGHEESETWMYRGTFCVTEGDVNGKKGPGFDSVRSIRAFPEADSDSVCRAKGKRNEPVQAGNVRFCNNGDYSGGCCNLGPGSYHDKLTSDPCPGNDQISLISVSPGCQVTVWEHCPNCDGKKWWLGPGEHRPPTFEDNTISGALIECDVVEKVDQASSVINSTSIMRFTTGINSNFVEKPTEFKCKEQACSIENDAKTCCTARCDSIANVDYFCGERTGGLITNAHVIKCKSSACDRRVDAERCCKPTCGEHVTAALCAAVNRVYDPSFEDRVCDTFRCQSRSDFAKCCRVSCGSVPFGDRSAFCSAGSNYRTTVQSVSSANVYNLSKFTKLTKTPMLVGKDFKLQFDLLLPLTMQEDANMEAQFANKQFFHLFTMSGIGTGFEDTLISSKPNRPKTYAPNKVRAFGHSYLALWLVKNTEEGKAENVYQLVASVDGRQYEAGNQTRYDYLLASDLIAQTRLGTFPWYLTVQMDVRDDNLAIYYLNKKQHEVRVPPAAARFPSDETKVYLYAGGGEMKLGRMKNIHVVNDDRFGMDQQLVPCGQQNSCTKGMDAQRCCRATCASITNINTFCNGWTPHNESLLSSTYCRGTVCTASKDRSACCVPAATCRSIVGPQAFCSEGTPCNSFNSDNMEGWTCNKITHCGKYGHICGGYDTKGKGSSIRRRYDGLVIGGTYTIQLDFIKIDSWDHGEEAYISFNGHKCWTYILDNSAGMENVCGRSNKPGWAEKKVTATCTRVTTKSYVDVRVWTNLGQGMSDESFGIDNALFYEGSNSPRRCKQSGVDWPFDFKLAQNGGIIPSSALDNACTDQAFCRPQSDRGSCCAAKCNSFFTSSNQKCPNGTVVQPSAANTRCKGLVCNVNDDAGTCCADPSCTARVFSPNGQLCQVLRPRSMVKFCDTREGGGGNCCDLPPGNYSVHELTSNPCPRNNAISYIKVPSGCTVKVWQQHFSGRSWDFSAGTHVPGGWDNTISSATIACVGGLVWENLDPACLQYGATMKLTEPGQVLAAIGPASSTTKCHVLTSTEAKGGDTLGYTRAKVSVEKWGLKAKVCDSKDGKNGCCSLRPGRHGFNKEGGCKLDRGKISYIQIPTSCSMIACNKDNCEAKKKMKEWYFGAGTYVPGQKDLHGQSLDDNAIRFVNVCCGGYDWVLQGGFDWKDWGTRAHWGADDLYPVRSLMVVPRSSKPTAAPPPCSAASILHPLWSLVRANIFVVCLLLSRV